jgi:hypothetical protein
MKQHNRCAHKMIYALDTISRRGFFRANCIKCGGFLWVTKGAIVGSIWTCWGCNKPFVVDEEAAALITGAMCYECRLKAAGDPKSLVAMLYTKEELEDRVEQEQKAAAEDENDAAYNERADAEDAEMIEEEEL